MGKILTKLEGADKEEAPEGPKKFNSLNFTLFKGDPNQKPILRTLDGDTKVETL
jgi:hypothetical protein